MLTVVLLENQQQTPITAAKGSLAELAALEDTASDKLGIEVY